VSIERSLWPARPWVTVSVAALLLIVGVGLADRFVVGLYGGAFPSISSALLEERGVNSLEYYRGLMAALVVTAFLALGVAAVLSRTWGMQSWPLYLALLLASDVYLIAIGQVFGSFLSVNVEFGIPEGFQYAKELAIAVLMYGIYRKDRRETAFLVLAALFVWLLIDDSMRIHERVGGFLATHVSLPSMGGSLPQDIGELVGLVIPAGVFLVMLAYTYFRASPSARVQMRQFAYLLALLGACGVFVDLLIAVLGLRDEESAVLRVFNVIEDGGEMVAMTCLLVFTCRLYWIRCR
jgi:hypothetical protein